MSLLAIAAVARWGVSGWIQAFAGPGFPWGTLVVNVSGSVLLGFLFRYMEGLLVAPELRQFVAIGLLGSFTTFSTFSYETVALLRDGELGRALGYAGGNVLLGIAGVVFGLFAAGLLLHPRP